MEEDIKILLKNLKTEKEKWIDKIYGVGETRIDLMIDDVIKAIENLVKGYKKLELENEELKRLANNKQFFSHIYIAQKYFPKSKIKEKIEEYIKMEKATYTDLTHFGDLRRDTVLEVLQVLQELMEDK